MVGAARKLNTDPASSAPADSTNNWLRQIMMDCSSDEGPRSTTLFDSIIKNLYRIEEHAPKVYPMSPLKYAQYLVESMH
jgi:hypothetical protein